MKKDFHVQKHGRTTSFNIISGKTTTIYSEHDYVFVTDIYHSNMIPN